MTSPAHQSVLPPAARVADAIYRQLFELSRDAIALIDLDGRYLEQNPAHEALLGYGPDDLAGRTPAIHLGEEAFAAIAEALQRTGWYRGEHRSVRKDGEVRHIELTAFPVTGPGGEIVAYAGIKRDLTDRRRDQEELQRLNHELTVRVKEYERVVSELERSQRSLRQKIEDMETFEEVVVGRELKMIQLEKELAVLRKQTYPS